MNTSHNFGQNKDRNVILAPGENHSEWSVRIASGLLNIIDDMTNSYQSISVTHRGAIFEIQQLIKMINDGLPMDEVEKYETNFKAFSTIDTCLISSTSKSKHKSSTVNNQKGIFNFSYLLSFKSVVITL